MQKLERFSYVFIGAVLVLAGGLRLATPLVTVLFCYFVLDRLNRFRSKVVSVVIFAVAIAGILYGTSYFVRQAIVAAPHIAETAIPAMDNFAERYGIELPFTDLASLKVTIRETVANEMRSLGNLARVATKEFVLFIIGVVVAASIFLNPRLDTDHGTRAPAGNLYSLACEHIVARFKSFYRSFEIVMGAQMIISAINTAFTSIYLLAVGLPYTPLVVAVTFFCGLLPIVGNLISNTVIISVSFTVSPKLAMMSLVFLVVIHKLEYFLNSKIIGERIRNPVWLTLLGLILGERLMGIPGMILAPVVLNYIKVEAARHRTVAPEGPPDTQIEPRRESVATGHD